MKNQKLTLEQSIEKVGASNKYQILAFIAFFFQFLISTYFFIGGPYLFLDPIFICESNNQTCSEKDACNQNYIISPESKQSITLDFKLYCNNQNLKSLAESFVFIGSLIGTFIFSFISDYNGRKVAQILAWGTATIGSIIFASAQNISMIIAGICISGIGAYPSNTITFIILTEQSSGKFRQISTALVLLGYTSSELFFDLLAYVFDNNWRTLMLYCTMIPMILLNIPNFFLIESPRFYINKDNAQVVKQFNKIASINKKPLLQYEDIDFEFYEATEKNMKIYNYLHLFIYRSLRYQTLAAGLLKCMMMFVLYGMTFSLGEIGLNIYINGLLGGVSETISMGLIGWVLIQFKRRWSLFVSGIVCNVLCTSFIFFEIPNSCTDSFCWQKVISIIFYSLGRFSSNIFFVVIAVYLPELFPTPIRGIGVGFIRAVGIAGSILSPYAVQFSQNINLNPLVLIGVIGIISMLNLIFLRETFQTTINDEIEELKAKPLYIQKEQSLEGIKTEDGQLSEKLIN